MQLKVFKPIICVPFLVMSMHIHAQDAALAPAAFKPFELSGDWQFTNADGIKYGGDVKVKVATIDTASVMRGVVSYDGRQTNDKCSTRGIYSDEPVEAEITKTNSQYRVSFNLKCLRGESPRSFSWVLVCEGATCSRATEAPNGKGAITLTERR